jgi:hypothetical protein
MFSFFKEGPIDRRSRKLLFDFLGEMERNMESFYVMDQRQFITAGFLTETWAPVKDMDIIKSHESIALYARATEDFNLSLKAYKDFEAWYTGNTEHKTQENSKKLHALKHELDLKLKAYEAVIIPAGQDLEREMLKLGLLKA